MRETLILKNKRRSDKRLKILRCRYDDDLTLYYCYLNGVLSSIRTKKYDHLDYDPSSSEYIDDFVTVYFIHGFVLESTKFRASGLIEESAYFFKNSGRETTSFSDRSYRKVWFLHRSVLSVDDNKIIFYHYSADSEYLNETALLTAMFCTALSHREFYDYIKGNL